MTLIIDKTNPDIVTFRKDQQVNYFELGVRSLIKRNFVDSGKFSLESETKKYIKDVTKGQILGKLPKIIEVYFENKYLCDVSEDLKPDEVLAKIEFALINKIKGGK